MITYSDNTGKTQGKFSKNAGEWTRRAEISLTKNKFLAVKEACTAIF